MTERAKEISHDNNLRPDLYTQDITVVITTASAGIIQLCAFSV